eukprot:6181569-Pleurochrysis_carterae.AAC.1
MQFDLLAPQRQAACSTSDFSRRSCICCRRKMKACGLHARACIRSRIQERARGASMRAFLHMHVSGSRRVHLQRAARTRARLSL